ncbi:zinc-binding oxidoreductase [Scheffersomyces coipomensis]|uniref:zinc-binding oxidoreductase n=1 Tax=Scheffersomyces coipomensis TaxID=1788519 RepID=UPI00315D3DEE
MTKEEYKTSSYKAAIISGSHDEGKLIEISSIEAAKITSKEILVKSVAYAVNPTDWKHIVYGLGAKGSVVGCDVSGVVEEVGEEVVGFKKGDIVSGFVHGNVQTRTGAFSEYVILNPITVIKYDASKFDTDKVLTTGIHPSDLLTTFEGAASVTLGLVTVAISFSHSLKVDIEKSKNSNDYILIWGGATATGVLAIQFAKLIYGLKVITTSSPKNFEYLKSLGADETFDYNDKEVVSKIKSFGKGSIKYGLDTIAFPETFQSLYDATETTNQVHLDSLLGLTGESIKTDASRKVTYGTTLAYTALGKDVTLGPKTTKSTPELQADYKLFWETVLPKYIDQLKSNNLKVLPKGLESANEALELLRQNKVSGEKVAFRY